MRKQLADLSGHADEIRKKIVATKEGGAITGEERLREHLDTLYGAIMSYDGKPADYQLARIDALGKELDDVKQSFAKLRDGEVVKVNAALKAKNAPEIGVPSGATAATQGSSGEQKGEENEVRRPFERD